MGSTSRSEVGHPHDRRHRKKSVRGPHEGPYSRKNSILKKYYRRDGAPVLSYTQRCDAMTSIKLNLGTGHDAGLSGDEQILLVLRELVRRGGQAKTGELYPAVEIVLNTKGFTLSEQGKSSLRFFINKVAVEAGYIHPHDRSNPGWRITDAGRDAVAVGNVVEEVAIDTSTGQETVVLPNVARGDAFELYVLKLLKTTYPNYAWYHQGRDKRRERGIDFVGNRLGDSHGEPSTIGVQVKFHLPTNAPTDREWLKFLSGCFARRLDSAIFVTTGRLTGEQRREAQEARVIVIEGRSEVTRLAKVHGLEEFSLFMSDEEPTSGANDPRL